VKIDSDQNGYAGIVNTWAIALTPRMITPTRRENWLLADIPNPTIHSTTPMHRTTQPQVLRLPTMW
jgi:hypothetical protein